ncbi:hypothetical protein HYC85_029407 [Camellia sinensis]|uniref:Uncharacterized protein n=1 Tax=Camellia sinensis TaxID=4442 RepID=A0A7J7G1Y1_CAMSI|nr:hypothetical protein HYC85_029407 [Camellia sinensis]
MAKREPEERADNVSISIAEKLANFYHPSSECCIFRMYDGLRKQNEKAYEPLMVAIGPYHRGKAKLKQMEEHKLWYLQQLLNREKNKSVNEYIMAIKELEESARNCYAETILLKSDEFVEMMLLDGFFIIELFRKFSMRQLRVENDHIFQSDRIEYALTRDLILLENQLPFFILVRLFNMTKTDSDLEIIQIAFTFLEFNAPDQKLEAPRGISINNIKHLLHLVHSCWCFKFAEMNRNATEKQLEFINSATELQESGIQFKKAEETNLFDIKFISGILEIPSLTIEAEVDDKSRIKCSDFLLKIGSLDSNASPLCHFCNSEVETAPHCAIWVDALSVDVLLFVLHACLFVLSAGLVFLCISALYVLWQSNSGRTTCTACCSILVPSATEKIHFVLLGNASNDSSVLVK